MSDLLNEFWKASESEKHLRCYSGLIRRARPYTLAPEAIDVITELASGPTIRDKLATYRILARLPFDTIWIEIDYQARRLARVKVGTTKGPRPVDTPSRMGWLMRRESDTTWRATTIIEYDASLTKSGRTVDTFGVDHIISTEGPVQWRSHIRDPDMRRAVADMNAPSAYFDHEQTAGASICQGLAWGFGTEADQNGRVTSISMPPHLANSNAVDLSLSWETMIEDVSKGVPSKKYEAVKKHMLTCARELQGDLRFLCAALATINEAPISYLETRQPGSLRIGGHIRPYMINRVVTIAIPKKRGIVNKLLKMLKLAERRMRRHEVSGYWKTIHFKDGRKERRWINEYLRGDGALGFVRQVREVVKS